MQKKYPFKFLDAYKDTDKDIFFGRDNEIKQLYEMVFQNNLIIVYGASGTGKTSLIQCGLASQFQSHTWFPLPIRRGNNINESFEKALLQAGGSKEATPQQWAWIDEDSHEQTQVSQELSPLAQQIKNLYAKTLRPIYLIFDQFEELYILGSKDEQSLFINTVKELLKVEQPLKIIFSIREEYLAYLYDFEKEVPELFRKKLRVEQMTSSKVKEILLGINAWSQSLISLERGREQEIADKIFEKVRGKERSLTIQLPYLQVFLDKFYIETTQDHSRKAEGTFTTDTLQKMGNIDNVLRAFLEEQVSDIAKELKHKEEDVWQILSQFITEDGTKAPLSFAQLQEKLKNEKALDKDFLQSIISGFDKRRILRKSEDGQLYEITHDSLAKQISEKQSAEDKAIKEISSLIKRGLQDYQKTGSLLSEKSLNYLFQSPYFTKIQLGEEEKQLIQKSESKIKRDKQWKRAVTIGLVLLTISSISTGIYSYYSFLQAQKATLMARNAQIKAEANLSAAYKAQKATIEAKITVAERNMQSFKQFHAQDLVSFENRKLDTLTHQKDSLSQLIK